MREDTARRGDYMKALIDQGGKYKLELMELEQWMLKNVSHADFIAKAQRRNWLTVEIDRIRKKMEVETGILTEKDYHDNIYIAPNRQMY